MAHMAICGIIDAFRMNHGRVMPIPIGIGPSQGIEGPNRTEELLVTAYLVPLSLFVVFSVLLVGIYSLFVGGDFGRSYSNKLMRLRVVAQFVAVLIIMGVYYFTSG